MSNMEQEIKAHSGMFEGNKNGVDMGRIWGDEARVTKKHTTCHQSRWISDVDRDPKSLTLPIDWF